VIRRLVKKSSPAEAVADEAARIIDANKKAACRGRWGSRCCPSDLVRQRPAWPLVAPAGPEPSAPIELI
jgi:hypothetical protein